MTKYNAGEILQFAIRIEENGKVFYQKLAEKFDHDAAVRDLFDDLARQEDDHRNFFNQLSLRAQDDAVADLPEEYFLYLRAFADNAIFTEEELDRAISVINDLDGALDFCMKRESDAVSYYTELKALVLEPECGHIDEVVQEEKRHYIQLHNLKKSYTGGGR